VDGLILM
jgi:rplA_bact: ribosomal protein L1